MSITTRTLQVWREAGLPALYDDVLEVENASRADRVRMAEGSHYDYGAQEWKDGHDHAHCRSFGHGRLLFCGSDRVTCYGELARS